MYTQRRFSDLKGMSGTLYFESGWFGKPWDNFYTVENAVVDEHENLSLNGNNWEITAKLKKIEWLTDCVKFFVNDLKFTFHERAYDRRDLGEAFLFYTGDEYPDLSTFV